MYFGEKLLSGVYESFHSRNLQANVQNRWTGAIAPTILAWNFSITAAHGSVLSKVSKRLYWCQNDSISQLLQQHLGGGIVSLIESWMYQLVHTNLL